LSSEHVVSYFWIAPVDRGARFNLISVKLRKKYESFPYIFQVVSATTWRH